MNTRIGEFLLHCKRVDFGRAALSRMERTFYQRFNQEILALCRSLPKSAQTDSILFLMRYAGIGPGNNLDFFANYYPPIWSILYWLSHEKSLPTERLNPRDVASAVTAQSMAMFLHSLDDHLTDGQVSVSPLTLLLRSQAWETMNSAFYSLAEETPKGELTIQRFIDDYYASNQNSTGLASLDKYCDLFRKQMAIVTVAPVILCMKLTGDPQFSKHVETGFGSFGIAWRLLDDIQDIDRDIETRAESSVYLCLPEILKSEWKSVSSETRDDSTPVITRILSHVLEDGIVDGIKARICAELQAASSAATECNMAGLAEEFRCLAHPLNNSHEIQGDGNGR